MELRIRAAKVLRRIERYTKTDMVYMVQTGFWSNAGTVFVSAASFVLYLLFNHFVTKEAYGTYQYLLSVAALVAGFTLTGMNSAVTRAVALGYEGTVHQALKAQLRWGLLPLIGSWVLGAYYLWAHNDTLGIGLLLIGVCVPITSALNTYGAYLQAKRDFKRGFLYSLWWNVPYYLAVGFVAIFFKTALLLLVANLITQTLGLIIAYRSTLKAYPPNTEVDPTALKYGAHLSIMGVIGSIAAQADAVLAFHFLGATALAVYSFATAIPDRLGALFKFIPAAAFPKFVGKAPEVIRQSLGYRLLLGTVLCAVFAAVYALAAPLFFSIFFPAYTESIPYSQWYALSLLTLMSGVLANALVAAGNVRTLYLYNATTPIVQVLLQCGGVIFFGLYGLIFARILGNVFTFLFGAVLYWRAK